MVRRSPFSPINIQKRRPRPAALDLAHSTFSSSPKPKDIVSGVTTTTTTTTTTTQVIHITHNGPYFCGDNDEHDEQARASAELAHTQALFSASLESEPIPGVRARSPTAYMTAGKSLPMEVEVNIGVDVQGRPSRPRAPLPTEDYKFPPTNVECQFIPPMPPILRPAVETPRRNGGCCVPLSWMKIMIMRALRTRARAERKLPDPVGFRERIAHADHEWRPTGMISCARDDKGRACLPELASDTFVDWPWR